MRAGVIGEEQRIRIKVDEKPPLVTNPRKEVF